MPDASFVHPPRLAVWLVDLFTPGSQAEAIPGDLLEEFSQVASKSGAAFARRWYWRQSVRTVAHLIGSGFRVAPWSIVGAVLGGYVLLWFGASLPERAIAAVLAFRRHHVTPYYTWQQVQAHMFWLNNGILIVHLLMSLFIGCTVAAAAKGREIAATMTLGLVSPVITSVLFLLLDTRYVPPNPTFLSKIADLQIDSCIMIVIGGVIVRESRSAMSRRPASARC